jgi:hypothetical protein
MKKLMIFGLILCILISISAVSAVADNETGDIDPDEINETDDMGADADNETDDEGEDATDGEVEETEDEAISEETEDEIELIQESSLGAEMRLLQLRKSVLKSFITAGVIIDYLSEKGENVTELEAIYADIGALKDEADSLDPESETAVEDFVNVKRDIILANHDFRKTSTKIITGEHRREIQQLVKDALADSEELEALEDEIAEVRWGLNAQRVRNMLRRMGAEDEELIARIESGEATREEVAEALKDAFNNMADDMKRKAKNAIKEAVNNREQIKDRVVNKIKETHVAVREARLQKRIDDAKLKTEKARERIQQEISKLQRVKRTLTKRIDALEQTGDRIHERVNDRRGDRE